MRVSEIVREELTAGGTDWVHFTKHPMLTINPNQPHRDPAGIYFFPASVTPEAEMWHNMPYRFTVNIRPDAHVLEVNKITPEQIYQMIDQAGIRDKFVHYITQYPPQTTTKMFDMAWEQLQGHYGYEGGKTRQYASFNAMLRRLGWQAILDDTGSIHSAERQQLLVLDPRIITNVRMEQKTGSGFAAMENVAKEVATLGQQFGAVTVGRITKPNKNTYYAERDNLLLCRIDVANPQDPDGNYCALILSIRPQFPDRISASVRYSRPSLGYGVGAEFSISKNTYMAHSGLEQLQQAFQTIFAPQAPAVTEIRKVPGPQLVGSGKDFRQQAGTNRSPKQPGRLVGSGKPMKVKPGFVG